MRRYTRRQPCVPTSHTSLIRNDSMNKSDFTRLRALLSYDKDTGLFTWIAKPNRRIKIGTVAGTTRNNGYIVIAVNGNEYLAHRLAWRYAYGAFPTKDIDHINGKRDDNRLSNLRLATRSENMQNQKRVKGYYAVKNGWFAALQVNKVRHYLGYYATEQEARAAYLSAKQKLHKFVAKEINHA